MFAVTPNLDRIAAGGVRFSNSFTTCPVCSPARATLWTGVYPSEHKIESCVYGFDNAISEFYPRKPTIFELFKEAGYTTAYYGKWHLGCADPGFFDMWRGYNSLGMGEKDNSPGSRGEGVGLYWVDGEIGGQYKPELETERFIDFLKPQASTDKPFFGVCSYYPPHAPATAPERFFAPYRGRGVPVPGYYAAIGAIDHYIGRILDALRFSGLEENTVLLFCSDHGDTHKYRQGVHKTTCYEEAIKIPLLLNWPGQIRGGKVVDQLVGLEDIMPTLLNVAGLEVPDHLHGQSLVPLLGSESQPWRHAYYVQNQTIENIRQRCLRTGQWKLILSEWPIAVKDYAADNYLFDLARDPEEQTNLYFDKLHTDTVAELASILGTRANELGDPLGGELARKALLETSKRTVRRSGSAMD